MRHRDPIVALTCVAGMVVLLATCRSSWLGTAAQSAGPQSPEEAVALAEALGLYHLVDGPSTTIQRVVISTMPVTHERIGSLRLNSPHHPGWIGTVSVHRYWRNMMANYDPACSAVWGEVFIYGDPELIRRLMAAPRP